LSEYTTVFGRLDNYNKGGVEIINDDPKNYVFSNMFEVASRAKPWQEDRRRQESAVRIRGHPRRGHVGVARDATRRVSPWSLTATW